MAKEVVKALITNSEGEVLLVRRTSGMEAGKYSLPGGKPKQEESYKAAIVREISEELGVLLVAADAYWERSDTSHSEIDPWTVFLFFGVIDDEPRPDMVEIDEARYVSEKEFAELFAQIAFDDGKWIQQYFYQLSSTFGNVPNQGPFQF
jgi:8-oxo-dGTP diphosphatase